MGQERPIAFSLKRSGALLLDTLHLLVLFLQGVSGIGSLWAVWTTDLILAHQILQLSATQSSQISVFEGHRGWRPRDGRQVFQFLFSHGHVSISPVYSVVSMNGSLTVGSVLEDESQTLGNGFKLGMCEVHFDGAKFIDAFATPGIVLHIVRCNSLASWVIEAHRKLTLTRRSEYELLGHEKIVVSPVYVF